MNFKPAIKKKCEECASETTYPCQFKEDGRFRMSDSLRGQPGTLYLCEKCISARLVKSVKENDEPSTER